LVDADYKFIWVQAGTNGACADAQLWNNCILRRRIENNEMGFPAPSPLPRNDRDTPYFLIGDDAFALKTWLMKPFSRRTAVYEQRIFNYRLSRARRIVENAFGIMTNRYRCFLSPLEQEPKLVRTMVLACCTLHNLMRTRYPGEQDGTVDAEDDNHNIIPGAWRNDANLAQVRLPQAPNLGTQAAKEQRDYLSAYYNSDAGRVR